MLTIWHKVGRGAGEPIAVRLGTGAWTLELYLSTSLELYLSTSLELYLSTSSTTKILPLNNHLIIIPIYTGGNQPLCCCQISTKNHCRSLGTRRALLWLLWPLSFTFFSLPLCCQCSIYPPLLLLITFIVVFLYLYLFLWPVPVCRFSIVFLYSLPHCWAPLYIITVSLRPLW